MASDAAAVLDAAGIESAHVLGMSMGGMIAQEFALQYPKRVRSLILGCTASGGPHAVQPEPEVLQILTLKFCMSPEEASRKINPFIYDAKTPQARIDEDFKLRMGGIALWKATWLSFAASWAGKHIPAYPRSPLLPWRFMVNPIALCRQPMPS
jgi:pimeloyl-ACP methyl ester carboxylesterase